ncbi:hypothetical protein WR25_03531 [Diploscapter pachys]|uniref:N-acetyltransferase domain-containing protein n=1 Tax=Diploscapter pachys TaxID=2018661 RepID=A0A2A2JCT5_9BILA|nr:hypothetical protein WR25_03531 [Diploscapter pachys]
MQKKWSEDEDKLTFILLQNHSENQQQEVENMIGDVNLFIDWSENSAEVEIMLAEPNARGKGRAHEAVSLMLSYALNNFPLTDFYAKIKGDNVVSQNLFEKKLGFVFESRSEVFDESTFKLSGQNLEIFKNYLDNTDAKILSYP